MEPKKIVIELGIAFLVNIAAGVIVFFSTKQLTLALITIVSVEAIIIVVMYFYFIHKHEIVGITDFAPTFAEGPSIATIVQSVTTEFAFWGISSKSLLNSDEFREIVIRKAKGDCVFKFLILDPNSPNVEKKAIEEGDTATGWKNEIEANIMRLKQLRDEHHLNIQVRLYYQFPVLRVIFVNSNLMYFGWYPLGLQGIRSPLLIVRNEQDTLYQPIRLSFNNLWDRSKNPYSDQDI
jgi:hypothetical protein